MNMNKIIRALLFLAATVAAVIAFSSVALALSANSWTTPKNYSGTCPATIQFNGMISGGSPGPVQYSFGYIDPSTNKSVPVGSASGTLDSNGSLQITQPVSFAAAQAGNSLVTLYALQGGIRVNSTATAFSITCTSAPRPPSGPSGPVTGGFSGRNAPVNLGANLPKIAAPTGLSFTNNQAVCATHVGALYGSLFCPASIINGELLMLIWNWAPCNDDPYCVTSIDGYHIYHPFAGASRYYSSHVLQSPLKTQSNPQVTGDFLTSFRGGECYVVTAYKGTAESPASTPFCTPRNLALGAQPVTLNPASGHVRSVEKYDLHDTGFFAFNGVPTRGEDSEPGVVHVGFLYGTILGSAAVPDTAENYVYRGAFWFDLSSLAAKTIRNATLHLQAQTTMGNPRHPNATLSCARYLGTGTKDWWNEDGWIDGDIFAGLSRDGPGVDVDVTSQVRQWMSGTQNNGFVLVGPEENFNAFTEDSCESYYNATLTVYAL